jgi:hypothetical protein
VKRPLNPFTSLLTRATDRLYAEPVSLAGPLHDDPLLTLHRISSNPAHFGEVLPFGDSELRRQRISDLLDMARIYLKHERKMRSDLRHQGELALPEQPG